MNLTNEELLEIARKREEERVEFLRRCAVSWAGSGSLVGNIRTPDGNDDPRHKLAVLAAQWSALFDAIEDTRGSK